MAVLLATSALTVTKRAHPAARDAHGFPMLPTSGAIVSGPYPGAAQEQQGGGWALRLDPRHWPVEPGDEASDGTLTWVLSDVLLHQVPGVPDVDFIGATGTRNPPKTA